MNLPRIIRTRANGRDWIHVYHGDSACSSTWTMTVEEALTFSERLRSELRAAEADASRRARFEAAAPGYVAAIQEPTP